MSFCQNPLCEHRKQSGKPAEFRPGVSTCSDCGSKLTEHIPDFPSQSTTPIPQFVNFKSAYSAETIAQVSIFKAILEQRGIKCSIRNDALSAGIGGLPPIETWDQLCVEGADYLEAKRIIEEAIAAKDNSVTWKCDSCGEILEDQFTECWNCGKSRFGSGKAATIHHQEEGIKNIHNHPDLIDDEDDEERKQTLRGLRIVLLILSVFTFLLGKFPLQPGQDTQKGLIGLAILLLFLLAFTYLPKGSN